MRYIFIFLILLIISCENQQLTKEKISKDKPRKYNVLFIIADDLATTGLSAYGNKQAKTPHIDKLARESTMYKNAYCQFPVCGPSRASLMTGYYPSATKVYNYVSGRKAIGKNRMTWTQYFKKLGYYTARVSKIYHMGVPGDIKNGSNGRDDRASWTERFNSQGHEALVPGIAERLENNPNGTRKVTHNNTLTYNMADGDDLVHSDGKTAQKASELIRKHKNKRFFLAVGFVRPHVPFAAPRSYFKDFPFNKAILPESVPNDWNDIPHMGINYRTSKNMSLSKEQKKKAIASYYAATAFLDAQVGKVLKTLKEEGLEKETIVIFTSDHGFHLGEHDFWMKVGLKDESSRVPMIIKVPGKKPIVCDSMVELIDLYPTISKLCGLSIPKNIQGKDISLTLDDPKHEVRTEAFSMNAHKGKSYLLRNKKWAYIQHRENSTGGIELYNIETDPKQFTNLAKKEEYKEIVFEFKKKLKNKLLEVRTNDLKFKY